MKFYAYIFILSCSGVDTTAKDSVHFDSSASAGGNESYDKLCVEGEKRACHVTLGIHEGVSSCFVGLQTCVDGEWTVCKDESAD